MVVLLEAVVSYTFFVAGNEWGRDLHEGRMILENKQLIIALETCILYMLQQ